MVPGGGAGMIHIVIPMGGEGKRFAERGYTFPKPLIEIFGKPIIEVVVNNVRPSEPHQFIFVCRKDPIENFALQDVLNLIAPESKVISMAQPTAGALCSVLLGIEDFANEDELVIVNADQFVDQTMDRFLAGAREGKWDGYIMTFPSTHPKWSYAKVEGEEVVTVAEKRPISHHATVGWYYFKRGLDFVEAAERMLVKNAALDGEFYVCPVYNELILMGKKISIHPLSKGQMVSLGTPEDLEKFSTSKAPAFFP